MYPAVITTDLHLTDNPSDAYRWSIFDTLRELREKHRAPTLIVMGDVTDAKDNHSAALVNKVVSSFVSLQFERVFILKGNHDYLQREHPFFGFMSHLPGHVFVHQPQRVGVWLFLPHSRATPLPGLDLVRRDTEYVFMHQTVRGAVASNGQEMEGELTAASLPKGPVYYSGDIHVPQKVGQVEYVGSPYPVHFGDKYTGRVLTLFEDGSTSTTRWDGLMRMSAKITGPEDIEALGLRTDDQLKVTVQISRADLARWHDISRQVQYECDKRGIRLFSVQMDLPASRRALIDAGTRAVDGHPLHVLDRYAQARGISGGLLAAGRKLCD